MKSRMNRFLLTIGSLILLIVSLSIDIGAEPIDKPYKIPRTSSFHLFNTIVDENKNVELNSLNEVNVPLFHYAGGFVVQANFFNFGSEDRFTRINTGIEVNRYGYSFKPFFCVDNRDIFSGKFEVTKRFEY